MLMYILPEIFCFILAVVFVLCSLCKTRFESIYRLALIFSFLNFIVVLFTINGNATLFYESYKVDLFSQSVKLLLALGLFLVVYMTDNRSDEHIKKMYPEFLFFLFTSNLGMMMLSSATELITLFLSLELSSYSMFVLAGFLKHKKVTAEAAVKFTFIGAVASAITLYGYSFLFAYFTNTSLFAMRAVSSTVSTEGVVIVGILFFLGAFLFKLAILPFSFWAPDVYQASDTSVTTYIATVSKVAGIAVLLRIFLFLFPVIINVEKVLLVVAVLTMTFGNLLAVQQKDLKRLLAYSSIAQAGYMLVGVVMMNETGASSTLFYVFSYLVMNFTVFLVADNLIKEQNESSIYILKGLSQRAPLLSLALLLALLSLGGVPPFVGFTGKWMIFSAAISKGYLSLVLIAFLNSVVSVYYYLLVARQAYLFPPDIKEPYTASTTLKIYSYFAIVFIILFGFFPTPMLNWTERAVSFLMMH